MARKRFIENSSAYTLRRTHQVTSKGTVFETDLMTITELDGFAPDQTPIYSNGNFKLTVGLSSHDTLKHKSGYWVKNSDNSEIWTAEDANSELSSSYKIKFRPNYSSLSDFAYYGSASELIRASLLHIILHYPGELYLSNDNYVAYDLKVTSDGYYNLGGDDKYVVDNPFLINVDALYRSDNAGLDALRYFCESYTDYIFLSDRSEEQSRLSWQVIIGENVKCPKNGDILATIKLGICNLYYYYYNGERILLHDYQYGTAHIRPKQTIMDEYYNALDDFEYFLINKEYDRKITLDTPRETEKGYMFHKVDYQWPKGQGDWNLDFNSLDYKQYADSLFQLAQFYDDRDSDNVVRSLTHEALKNFDWTFTKSLGEDGREMETPNAERIEAMLHIYGRNFDDIRKDIAIIQNSTNISYDGNNNTPDYFLSDQLELSGWEVKNPLDEKSNILTDTGLYPGRNYGYSSNDANNQFMRVLKLNTKAIMNAKGTKRGLEMLLALFGFHSDDFYRKLQYVRGHSACTWNDLSLEEQRDIYMKSYSLSEYVGVAVDSGTSIGYESCPNDKVREINAYKDGYAIPISNQETLEEIELQGLPVKAVTLTMEDTGNTEYTYLVPWFDNTKLYQTRDFYFQSKGGWNKQNGIAINVEIEDELVETELFSDDTFGVYDETSGYLHFAQTINSLLETIRPKTGDIYYVRSIADSTNYRGFNYAYTMSHYFILEDENNSNILGVKNGEYGWKNIPLEEILSGTSVDGKRILYMESIIEDNTGNNPHTGKGLYDGGEEYLNNFRSIFKDATFEGTSDELIEGYEDLGFNIVREKDNVKCWFFTDTMEDLPNLYEFKRETEETISGVTWQCGDYYVDADSVVKKDGVAVVTMEPVQVGTAALSGEANNLRESELMPYNMELGVSYDEAAANSILNLKYFDLDFHPNPKLGFSQRDFIKDIVMYYAKQMIPATAILSTHIPDSGIDAKSCPDTELARQTASIASFVIE